MTSVHERKPEGKLKVMKSLRMSEVLLRMVADECKSRNLGFSDYMRDAAVAAMRQEAALSDTQAD
jgi:hypothetical protein